MTAADSPDPPVPPGELCGGLATLWCVGASDAIVAKALGRILADNSWPAGREYLEQIVTAKHRADFVERCWRLEKEATAVDASGQTRKRARLHDF